MIIISEKRKINPDKIQSVYVGQFGNKYGVKLEMQSSKAHPMKRVRIMILPNEG